MDPDVNQLQGMDLMQLGENDSKIENELEWEERKNIHDGLEISTLVENRPSKNYSTMWDEQLTQKQLVFYV